MDETLCHTVVGEEKPKNYIVSSEFLILITLQLGIECYWRGRGVAQWYRSYLESPSEGLGTQLSYGV